MAQLVRSVYLCLVITALGTAVIRAGDLIDDPSRVPLEKKMPYETGERLRILADFNLDGLGDMALSDDLSMGGQGGIGFHLYVRDSSGKYFDAGEFGGKAGSIAIENNWKCPRIWSYWRMGSSGILGYREVTDTGLTRSTSIEIYTGDGGSKIGNAILKAVRGNSDAPIRLQRSKTFGDTVTWIDEKGADLETPRTLEIRGIKNKK